MSDGIGAARHTENDISIHTHSPVVTNGAQPAAGALAADAVTRGSAPPPASSLIPASAVSPAAAQTEILKATAFDSVSRQLYQQVQAAYQAIAATNQAGHGQAREPQPDEASTIQTTAQGGNAAFDSSNGHIGDASVHAVAQPGVLENQSVDHPVAVTDAQSRRVRRHDDDGRQQGKDEDDADEPEDDDDSEESHTFASLVRPMNADRTGGD